MTQIDPDTVREKLERMMKPGAKERIEKMLQKKPNELVDATPEYEEFEYNVLRVVYSVHTKRDAPPYAPQTMRVRYYYTVNDYVSEWICFEHVGFAREKAVRWWQQRTSAPIPYLAADAVLLANEGVLAEPTKIKVRKYKNDPFPRIVAYVFPSKDDPDDFSL